MKHPAAEEQDVVFAHISKLISDNLLQDNCGYSFRIIHNESEGSIGISSNEGLIIKQYSVPSNWVLINLLGRGGATEVD